VQPNPAQGAPVTFTATFSNLIVPSNTPVIFTVIGPNFGFFLSRTNAQGQATFTYAGIFTGTEVVIATATVGANSLTSNLATLVWTAGPHTTFCDLNLSVQAGSVGASSSLSASLYDISVIPAVAVTGASLALAVGGQSCSSATNSAGLARCSVVPASPGVLALTGTYTGSSQFLGTSCSNSFTSQAQTTQSLVNVAAAAGGQQTANLGAQFTVPFQVTVTDTNNNPVQGVTVTFTAPSSGASGTFPGNLLTVTATTNASGVATAPPFVANSTAGTYTVTATVANGAAPASFTLTNGVQGSGATALFGNIASKQGLQNARVWTFQIGNSGTGTATAAQIGSIQFTQEAGAACSPAITSPATFPLALGNIPAGSFAQGAVTINFTGCVNTASFSMLVQLSANGGAATGSIVRNNEER
jgi:hypothetical protein